MPFELLNPGRENFSRMDVPVRQQPPFSANQTRSTPSGGVALLWNRETKAQNIQSGLVQTASRQISQTILGTLVGPWTNRDRKRRGPKER